jgi:antitoxin component of RelBE/YafQ-DinJ toxin-antitoxin module
MENNYMSRKETSLQISIDKDLKEKFRAMLTEVNPEVTISSWVRSMMRQALESYEAGK